MWRFDPMVVVLLLIVGCGGARVTGRASQPVDVLKDPQAQAISYDTSVTIAVKGGEFKLMLLDRYDISGIVVARQKFSSGWSAKLAPVDLSLAWGEITAPEEAKYVKYKHSGRWYHYWIAADSPVNQIDVIEHSCNCHVIPANRNVMRAARAVKKNAAVRLAGYLVNVDGKYQGGDYWWYTSRSRSDTGDGSCEVFYVTCIQIGSDLYE